MIIRRDRGGALTFDLFADCSYAGYLWDAILDAGREFGMRPVGWEAMAG
jgi:glycine cleavage system aminomethyltransferase T